MFDIEYKGGNAVVIATKKTKVMIDPRLSVVGLKDPSVTDAVVLATDPELAIRSDDSALTVDGPGEYEISDISVRAIAADRYGAAQGSKDLTIYRIEVGDVRIVILGNIRAELSEGQLEALGVVDIVILPVGGGDTLNAVEATQLVRAVDAKVVVPVHYADKGLKYDAPQDELEVFSKEYNGSIEQVGKYKVKSAASIPQASTIVEIARA